MKLLTRTSLNYFISSLILLVIFGGLLYWSLKKEILTEMREQLELETQIVVGEMKDGHPINHPFILIALTDRPGPFRFRDTAFVDPVQNKLEGYYALTTSQVINGKNYDITVITAYIGWDEYYRTIGVTILGLIVLLFATAGVINYFISKKIWRPFLINLRTLKKYRPSSASALTLERSDITEFDELNTVLADLAERARSEYLALQEFTENSSHELQTPIAIIRSRLESLSQKELDAECGKFLNDAKTAIDRLSKVNKSLLLLAKLRSGTFPDMGAVDMATMMKEQIEILQDLFASRDIQVFINFKTVNLSASLYLTQVLVSNLLSNAFKFADEHSLITVSLTTERLEIANYGAPLSFPAGQLFGRFIKGRDKVTGAGLGLSIVKQICALHKWRVGYRYDDRRHIFTVNFNTEN